MNNKGFTLIELLAVIVILAIIALIATPIILNIINDARDSAKKRTAELVISQVETAYSTAYMANNGNYPTAAQVAAKFSMDGATLTENQGTLTLSVSMAGVTCTPTTTGNVLAVTCTVGEGNNAFTKATTGSLSLGTAPAQQQGGEEPETP